MRRLLLLAVPLLLGTAVAAVWVAATGGSELARGLARARPAWATLLVVITAWWLVLRFVRWQFLLRRAGVRVPVRGSMSSYLAGLPGTATPAYVGELLRGVFLKRRFGAPFGVTAAVLILERLYDVAALALLALALGAEAHVRQVGALFVAVAFAAGFVVWRLAPRLGLGISALGRLRAPGTVLPALVLSLGAWGAACLLILVAAGSLGLRLAPATSVSAYTVGTLLGAASLVPAGMAVAGSVAILELGHAGVPVASAVVVVSLMRLMSTGVALSLGTVFLWHELRRRPSGAGTAAVHFDEIAAEYSTQFAPHVWELLLGRKLDYLAAALPSPPPAAGLGLDLGCGLGFQAAEMRRRGFSVVGIDPAHGLLVSGAHGAPLLAGDALRLPFRDGTFAFVYTIGVLHHLPGRQAQRDACREVARVLKPDGLLLVHESNPRNPLFRFYMGYVFPMLKSIDEGTEWWIEPDWWRTGPLALEHLQYFTFLPDFTPRALMRPAIALESWLERGPTRSYSAHYLARLRKPAAGLPGAPR